MRTNYFRIHGLVLIDCKFILNNIIDHMIIHTKSISNSLQVVGLLVLKVTVMFKLKTIIALFNCDLSTNNFVSVDHKYYELLLSLNLEDIYSVESLI